MKIIFTFHHFINNRLPAVQIGADGPNVIRIRRAPDHHLLLGVPGRLSNSAGRFPSTGKCFWLRKWRMSTTRRFIFFFKKFASSWPWFSCVKSPSGALKQLNDGGVQVLLLIKQSALKDRLIRWILLRSTNRWLHCKVMKVHTKFSQRIVFNL